MILHLWRICTLSKPAQMVYIVNFVPYLTCSMQSISRDPPPPSCTVSRGACFQYAQFALSWNNISSTSAATQCSLSAKALFSHFIEYWLVPLRDTVSSLAVLSVRDKKNAQARINKWFLLRCNSVVLSWILMCREWASLGFPGTSQSWLLA